MIKKEVLAALNKQIQHELNNEYTYLGLAVWFEAQLLKGFGAFFRKQASDEHGHATKILQFVLDRGGQVKLGDIAGPKTEFTSVLQALKTAQALEQSTTAAIHALFVTAQKAADPATENLMRWYIDEQVEEEQWADEYVGMAEKIRDSVGSLFMLDHRVAKEAKGE